MIPKVVLNREGAWTEPKVTVTPVRFELKISRQTVNVDRFVAFAERVRSLLKDEDIVNSLRGHIHVSADGAALMVDLRNNKKEVVFAFSSSSEAK